ncbi:MAG: HYR domain-containing protein [Bacteroidia bacterium]
MIKTVNRILFLAIACLLGSNLSAQVSLYLETFETDGEGSRYTSNTYNLASPTCDFFQRETASPLNVCFAAPLFTGFRGNFFWGSEDVRASPGTQPIGTLTSSLINIAGYTSLQVSVYVATSGDNGLRWEIADVIEVQANINGAGFQTVGRFMGNGTAPGTPLYLDANLNGTVDSGELTPIISVPTFTKYTFNIPSTGNNLQVRISMDQVGGSEEFGFDDIEVTGVAPSCTPPTITCPSTQSLALNAFCQATLVDYTSLATVTGNCSPTVTQSPVSGTTVSGAGAMTVSLFATNTLLQSATCTFTVNKTTPEVEVRGNSTIIADNDATPTTADHTDFGSVLTCTGTLTRIFTINNLTGTFGRILNVGTVTVGGTNAADFTVTAQPASTVPVGNSTTFTVVCNPSADGLRTATLSFTTDDCDENPYNFSIQATGNADIVDPTIICPATQSLLLNSSCQATLPDYTGLATGVTDNCPGSPTITQSPAIGSTQSGVGSLVVSLFATDGSLNSNTCTFTVNKVSPEIAVSGNSTTIVDGDVTPSLTDHTDFGSLIVGNNIVRTYTISNSGTGNLTLGAGSITVSGGNAADFVIGGITLPITIGPSLNTTFTVTFTPSATGLRTTTLNIANNDCDENPYNYSIQGTGLPASPDMNVKGNSVSIVDGDITPTTTDHTDFGSVAACTGTIVRTFTIENVTGADLTLGAISITGAAAADFTVTASPTSPVTAGNSTTFNVTFDPSAVGLRSATISIANNDPDENPYDFAIQGTGNADVTNPTITCPLNITIGNSTGLCAATATYTAPVGTDNCSGATTTQIVGLASGATYPVGVTTNTFRVTDASGNTATCSFTVTVNDGELPVLANLSCQSSNATGAAYGDGWQNGDNDGSGFGAWTLNASTGNTGQAGFFIGSSTTNGAGTDTNADNDINTSGVAWGMYANSSQATEAIRPITGNLIVGRRLTLEFDNGFVDNGQIVGFQLQNSSGGSLSEMRFRGGQATYEIVDVNGITTFASVPFTDEGLIIEVTPVTTGTCNIKLTRKVNGATQTLLSVLNPGGGNQVISRFKVFNSNAGTGTTNNLLINNAQICTGTPGCPTNVAVNNTPGQCSAPATYNTVIAGDNCSTSLPVTQTTGLASGATFPVGVTTNTFRATDLSGNSATCSFTVTVTDNQVPTITCPLNITINNTVGQCAATAVYTSPVGTDNCAGSTTTQTAGLASGASYPVGVTTNVFRVTDASGNTATCSFTVTVNDNQAPTITCPANINTGTTVGQCAATVTYTAPVGADNCGGSITTQTAGLTSGASFPIGTTTNVFRVTDASGNTATCSFTVTVSDNQAPTITCPANISVNNTSGQCSGTATYTAPVGTDNCPGATTTQTAGLASGATYPIGVTTNTFRATDAVGNTATCSFTVTVTDNELPTITCPANGSVNATLGSCSAAFTYTAPVGSDNCAGSTTTQTAGLASGATFPAGVTTNTFRVTDASGNSATCSFTVTVVDNQAPAITCPVNGSVNATSGQCSATFTYTAPTGTDNCAGSTTTQTAGLASGATYPVGVTTNVFRVTDASGNTATCSFTVTVVDNQVPTITCPSNISVNNTTGQCSATATYTAPTGADNCAGSTTTQTSGLASGATFPVGVTTNVFRVTDASGNTATCSFTVTVVDNQLPSIICPANVSVSATSGQCNAAVTYSTPSGTDNCAGSTTAQTAGFASGATFPVGVTNNIFRVTDASGNTSTCAFTVTVTDNQLPVIACPSNISVNNTVGQCAATVTYTAPVGNDNCPGSSTTPAGFASGATFPVGVTNNIFRVTDARATPDLPFTVT